MAEFCSFYWKSIFSKASCGSQDIIQNIPLESKQMIIYCFRRVKAVKQEVFFFLTNDRRLKFLSEVEQSCQSFTKKSMYLTAILDPPF